MNAPPTAGRLFVAVPLGAPTRRAVAAYLARAFGPSVPGRAVLPDAWHLTLRFLGETPAEAAARLRARLAAADLGRAFDLSIEGPGAFPSPARARVLWLGVGRGAGPLATLAAAVEAAALAAGFAPETRPFEGHLTVSRLKVGADLRAEMAAAPPFSRRERVSGIVLLQSHLGAGPPRYVPLETFPLAPA